MTLANLEENRITLGRPRAPCSWPRTFCGSSARACIRMGRRAQQLAIATRPHPRRSTPCRSELCEGKPIGLGWARWPPNLCRPLASQSEDCVRRLPPAGRYHRHVGRVEAGTDQEAIEEVAMPFGILLPPGQAGCDEDQRAGQVGPRETNMSQRQWRPARYDPCLQRRPHPTQRR
jgi:hypothetical protein